MSVKTNLMVKSLPEQSLDAMSLLIDEKRSLPDNSSGADALLRGITGFDENWCGEPVNTTIYECIQRYPEPDVITKVVDKQNGKYIPIKTYAPFVSSGGKKKRVKNKKTHRR